MPSTPIPIRVLSVDDHPLMRKGIAAVVGRQADMVVGEADKGAKGLDLFRRSPKPTQAAHSWPWASRPKVCIGRRGGKSAGAARGVSRPRPSATASGCRPARRCRRRR